MTVVGVVCACTTGEDAVVGAQMSPRPSIVPLPPPTFESETAEPAPIRHAATFARTDDGVVLPDGVATPGAVFDDVTASDICEFHYTQGVRQPRFNTKVSSFANYGISIHDRDIYQVDHLVPISLGGSNAEENIWPQPHDEKAGAAQKDLLERQLRGLVCSNKLTLTEAQTSIAHNWWRAYNKYMGLPIDPGSDGPEPPKGPTVIEGEVVNGGLCDEEGEVGYTEPKRIRLTCTANKYGELRWQKRY